MKFTNLPRDVRKVVREKLMDLIWHDAERVSQDVTTGFMIIHQINALFNDAYRRGDTTKTLNKKLRATIPASDHFEPYVRFRPSMWNEIVEIPPRGNKPKDNRSFNYVFTVGGTRFKVYHYGKNEHHQVYVRVKNRHTAFNATLAYYRDLAEWAWKVTLGFGDDFKMRNMDHVRVAVAMVSIIRHAMNTSPWIDRISIVAVPNPTISHPAQVPIKMYLGDMPVPTSIYTTWNRHQSIDHGNIDKYGLLNARYG